MSSSHVNGRRLHAEGANRLLLIIALFKLSEVTRVRTAYMPPPHISDLLFFVE